MSTGFYSKLLANGWTFFYGTRGWRSTAAGATVVDNPPASWNVAQGHYYATKDVTYWENAQHQVTHTWINYTNSCRA